MKDGTCYDTLSSPITPVEPENPDIDVDKALEEISEAGEGSTITILVQNNVAIPASLPELRKEKMLPSFCLNLNTNFSAMPIRSSPIILIQTNFQQLIIFSAVFLLSKNVYIK
ncbi:hypothetical protein Q5O24_06650 [Eubacteriaceae bacterium ES3]|nr:hypothetical protein Q5O24_06650 [Eubacteriaceae bacterium ES3]